MKGWPDTVSNSIRLKPHFSDPCTRKRASEVEHRLTAGAIIGVPSWDILITIPVFPRLSLSIHQFEITEKSSEATRSADDPSENRPVSKVKTNQGSDCAAVTVMGCSSSPQFCRCILS